ncbi:MAG: class I SAM-dependent methyltransferase [Filomicrobium sp.]
MVQAHKFWDKMADGYSKKPVADEESYQKKIEVTREYLRPDMEVLEFGCGTGATAISHAPCVKHIQAIDISSRMIEIAQGKAAASNVNNVTFARVAIDELGVPDQTFDAVLGLSILHLVENKEDVILKIWKMLKPGGIFVSSTACIGDTLNVFKFIAPIGEFFRLLPPIRVFKRSELEESLKNVGFDIDYQWQPGSGKAVFIVAKKAA